MTRDGVPLDGTASDTGWDVGISRTVPYPVVQVWEVIAGRPDIWLGQGATLPEQVGEPWSCADGTAGELRGRTDQDRISLTWRAPGRQHDTVLQVSVAVEERAENTGRTVIHFHQERLAEDAERSRQRNHWAAVLDRVIDALGREWTDAPADPADGAPETHGEHGASPSDR